MRRFTILLAAHDRLAFLQEAVRSALEQGRPDGAPLDFDVLVVDDGSGAETADWLDAAARAEPRLKVIHQPNRGVGAARAAGVRAASRELVTILDSDDRLRPDALHRTAALLDAQPDTDLVYVDHDHLLPDGQVVATRYCSFASNDAMLWATFVRPRVPFKHSGTTFRRDVALELGNYDAHLGIKVDIDFFARFLAAGRRLRHLPGGAAVAFRTHQASMSRRRLSGIRAWWTIIDRYGPRSVALRLYAKTMRAFFELLKSAYTAVRWTER